MKTVHKYRSSIPPTKSLPFVCDVQLDTAILVIPLPITAIISTGLSEHQMPLTCIRERETESEMLSLSIYIIRNRLTRARDWYDSNLLKRWTVLAPHHWAGCVLRRALSLSQEHKSRIPGTVTWSAPSSEDDALSLTCNLDKFGNSPWSLWWSDCIATHREKTQHGHFQNTHR